MDDRLQRLEHLARLHEDGALSAEEFESEKRKLLGGGNADDNVSSVKPGSPSPRNQRTSASVKAIALALAGGLIAATSYYYFHMDTPSPPPAPDIAQPALPSTAAPSAPERSTLMLDDTLEFANPANCEAAKSTDALFDNVLTPPNGDVANISTKSIRVGNEDVEVTPVLTKTAGDSPGDTLFEGVANFPQPATWHGLRVRGISTSLYVIPGSDNTYWRQIRYLEDPETLRLGLNKLGFGIPSSPGYSELHDDSCGGSMQIIAQRGGSALQCRWGC